jgi:PKD repeat protein
MSAPTRKSRILALVLPTVVAAFAYAAPGASAADFCVGTHPSCASFLTYPATGPGLQVALSDANTNGAFPGADTVYVGAGEYVIDSTQSLSLSAPLTVIGEGRGETIVKAGANNVIPLWLYGTGASTLDISELTIRHEGYSQGYGLTMGAGLAHDLEFSVVATTGSVRGAQISANGAIEDSTISMTGNGAIGLYMTGSTSASGVEVTSTNGLGLGIQSGGPSLRSFVESSFRNVKRAISSDQGPILVRDSFFDLGAISNAIAVESENNNNCGTCALELDATNLTVVGTGSGQVGVAVGGTASNDAAETGTGTVLNSYFDLSGSGAKAMRCTQSGANTSASLESDYVAAEVARIARSGSCTGTDANLLDTTSLTPAYNLMSAGDYRPVTGSPLIDAGLPGMVIDAGVEDAVGLDRIFDGNGDLSDRVDIGAYEYQPAMKPGITFTATPSSVDPGQNVNFSATTADPDGGAVSVVWAFGDGNGDTGATTGHIYTGAGDYTVTATATDNEGQSSTASKTVHVNSVPPTTPVAEASVTQAVRFEDITFTASGSVDPNGDDFTYEWTFTGGGTESGASVEREATQVGVFTATVRAVDVFGQESAPDSVDVTIVNQQPGVPTINKDMPTAFRGDTFTFTDTTLDPDGDTLGRQWDFGDGTTTGYVSAGPQTHSYSTVGVKTIALTVNDSWTTNTGSTTVEVLDRAPVLGALTRSGGSKIGDAQAFGISATDADGDPVTFSWNFGDGATATGATASHTYTAPGTFSVVVSANDGQGAVVTAQTSVTIDPPVIKLTKQSKKTKAGKKNPIAVNASSAAVVKITLARAGAGWVKGKKCVTKRPSSKAKKRCDLLLKKSLTRALPAGDSKIPFAGTWAGKRLAPGKYRMTVSPDQGGKMVSVLVTIL